MSSQSTPRAVKTNPMTPEIAARIEAMSDLFTPEQWHFLPNLDDPFLVQKVLSRAVGPPGTISASFSAIPQHDPSGFTQDLNEYGIVYIENQKKLAIRVKNERMETLNFIRQVWVSKYLTAFQPCSITFDVPGPTGWTNVVMQQVTPAALTRGMAAATGNTTGLTIVAEEDESGGDTTTPTVKDSPTLSFTPVVTGDSDFVDNNDVMSWPCRSPIPEDDEDEKDDEGDESVPAVRRRALHRRANSLPDENALFDMADHGEEHDYAEKGA